MRLVVDPYRDRLKDILHELGFATKKGIEIGKVTRIIQRETLRSWPDYKLYHIIEGRLKLSIADIHQLSEALRVDVRWFIYKPEEIPTYSKRRPKSIWDRLPPAF
ncbi:hypothetical protein [Singulisphaera sp. PoT]|uniref:hypothetical protein n=1 Tax=Singulisphaera sp. PoT TaxID=3411797 RepID=UPI003BF485C0